MDLAPQNQTQTHIQHVAIPVVDDIRFLGVIFGRKLTFLPHILHLGKKYERSLNILKILSKTSWVADRTSLLRIYQAVILSRIDYGCHGSALFDSWVLSTTPF
ncbi:hypothetical protein AVEN_267413-1 [Araneus ventricosus]|uniref:Uncharacterized protein n=1 Tax=Araneus ventricosus TaxID=182803 RepID=A0A4Y2FC36_ARAVE|nr:hypothetical protein AVEN_267413-1 [Araneus ventricosus]